MQCTKCQFQNIDGVRFCNECGFKFLQFHAQSVTKQIHPAVNSATSAVTILEKHLR